MRCPSPLEKFTPRRPTLFVLMAAMAAGSGCRAAKFAGKATLTTISITTGVTCATVRGTGKVAGTAADVSIEVASAGVKAASRFSKQGAVVFIDPFTGVVAELPWQKNLTLLAATHIAGLGGATQVARLIRAGQAIDATRRDAGLVLAAGDVVELLPRRRV